MLRRAENVGIHHDRGFWGLMTGNGWLTMHVGRKTYRIAKVHKTRYQQIWSSQRSYPTRLCVVETRQYWAFQNKFFWDNDDLTSEQIYALLWTRQQRETARVERAMSMVVMGSGPRQKNTDVIPDDVKQFVWMRDNGRCVNCGSSVELQFDHIIPRSKGGTSTEPANIQVLCGPCNRRKAAGFVIR